MEIDTDITEFMAFIYFFYLAFLSRPLTNHGAAGERGGDLLPQLLSTMSTCFTDTGSSWTITADSSPLHTANDRTRTGKLYFSGTSCRPLSHAHFLSEYKSLPLVFFFVNISFVEINLSLDN